MILLKVQLWHFPFDFHLENAENTRSICNKSISRPGSFCNYKIRDSNRIEYKIGRLYKIKLFFFVFRNSKYSLLCQNYTLQKVLTLQIYQEEIITPQVVFLASSFYTKYCCFDNQTVKAIH